MAGIGPVPLASLMLSEMGAEVLRIERAGSTRPFLTLPDEYHIDRHGRSNLRLDLKRWEGAELVLRLAERADMLSEGFRPDVMERLGLGPDAVLARNSALIYGRTTGFGHNGPPSDRASRDITYLAYSGVLHAIGQEGGRPVPPAQRRRRLWRRRRYAGAGALAPCLSVRAPAGQVIDAAMTEGASMLTTLCTP
ncbi:CoA transferase [Mesorhizobium sp. AA22]|uniref:CoA transferase n=1 Tax=Mesorhizobium sp. AA22 TaxID=1854057 RepID=UPI000B305F03|nr:CoA transferase [Mesorhizobium sp. AA22]